MNRASSFMQYPSPKESKSVAARRIIVNLLVSPEHDPACDGERYCHACEAQEFVGWNWRPRRRKAS